MGKIMLYNFYCTSIRCAKCQIFDIWHTKKSHMRWSICQNIWHGWIIQSQNEIWKCMDKNCKIFIVFLISFSLFSYHSNFFLSSSQKKISSSLILSQHLLFSSLTLDASPLFLSWSASQGNFEKLTRQSCRCLIGGI